jgi:hypothetical protein
MVRHHHDPRIGADPPHPVDRVDARQLGHRDVEQHHVRRGVRQLPQRFPGVAALADHLDPLDRTEQRAQARAHELLVLDQVDSDAHGRRSV